MNVKKVLVTPSYAKELLESNTKNRKVSDTKVVQYANDILNGKWKEDTWELVKISKTNVIMDGQHRLLAIIKANKPLYLQIVTDLEDSVFDVLDTGKSRSAVDCFKIEGVKNENLIPSTIIRYKSLSKGRVNADGRGNSYTNAQLLALYNEKPNFWQNVAKKSKYWYSHIGKIIPPSYIGGFYALFCDISNQQTADEFMNQLSTGNDIKNNAITLMRTKLMNDRMSIKKMPTELKGALMIKTWNFFRTKQNPKLLKWNSETEEFPKAI